MRFWAHLLLSSFGATAPPPPVPCGTGIPASAPWANCTLNASSYGPLPVVGVLFTTSDNGTQQLFDHAELCAVGNRLTMGPGFDVMVEGGGYGDVWLETQPMAGGMYAVRNLTLALNNQLIFMRTQRQDGRLPGMVSAGPTWTGTPKGSGVVHPTYAYPHQSTVSMLQGFFMATPAVDVAWFLNATGRPALADELLLELEPALIRFNEWLWSARNSSHGVLWLNGTSDTGEDGSDRLSSIASNPVHPPFESMDMMGYVVI